MPFAGAGGVGSGEIFRLAGVIAINRGQAVADLQAVEGAAQNTGSRMGAAIERGTRVAERAVKIGMAAATTAIVGTAVAGLRAFREFEAGMAEVFTLLPDITDEIRNELTEGVKELSREFGILPDEIVPALYQAISAGIPPTNVLEFMRVASRAAIAGVTDLDTAVDGLTTIIAAYGSENMSAQRASDALFTGMRMGKTTIDELSSSMGTVVPIASSLGIEIETVTAALSTMTLGGMDTATSATYLRGLLAELADEGRGLGEVFHEIADQNFADFIAAGGTLEDALMMIRHHADTTGSGMISLAGRVQAAQAAIILTARDGETLSGIMDAMADSAGATDDAFEGMTGTFDFAMNRMRAWWRTVLIDVGERLAPAMGEIIDELEKAQPQIEAFVIRTFERLADALLWIVNNASAVATAFGAMGSALALLWIKAHPVIAALAGLSAVIGWATQAQRDFTEEMQDVYRALEVVDDATGGLVQSWESYAREAGVSEAASQQISRALMDAATAASRVGAETQDASEALTVWQEELAAIRDRVGEDFPEMAAALQVYIDRVDELLEHEVEAWQARTGDIADAERELQEALRAHDDERARAAEERIQQIRDVDQAMEVSRQVLQQVQTGVISLDQAHQGLSTSHRILTAEVQRLLAAGEEVPPQLAERIALIELLVEAQEDEAAATERVRAAMEELADEVDELEESQIGLLAAGWRVLGQFGDWPAMAGTVVEAMRDLGVSAQDVMRGFQRMARTVNDAIWDMVDNNIAAHERYEEELERIGEQQQQRIDSEEERRDRELERLKERLDEGLLTHEEYEKKRQDITQEAADNITDINNDAARAAEIAEEKKSDALRSWADVARDMAADVVRSIASAVAMELAGIAAVAALRGQWVRAALAAAGAAAVLLGGEAFARWVQGIPGLAEGGVFRQATVLVGEGRHEEAVLPLNEDVYRQLGRGIVDAAARDQYTTSQHWETYNVEEAPITMERMFEGATITVRSQADIEELAAEIHERFRERRRAGGRAEVL